MFFILNLGIFLLFDLFPMMMIIFLHDIWTFSMDSMTWSFLLLLFCYRHSYRHSSNDHNRFDLIDWLIDFLNWIIHKETFFLNCHRMCNLMCFYVCSVYSVCVFVAKFNWSAIVSFVKKKSILFFLIFIFSLWFCSNHHHHCFVLFCFVW